METLPTEIHLLIAEFIPADHLYKLAVSNYFNQIATDDIIWIHKCQKLIPDCKCLLLPKEQ